MLRGHTFIQNNKVTTRTQGVGVGQFKIKKKKRGKQYRGVFMKQGVWNPLPTTYMKKSLILPIKTPFTLIVVVQFFHCEGLKDVTPFFKSLFQVLPVQTFRNLNGSCRKDLSLVFHSFYMKVNKFYSFNPLTSNPTKWSHKLRQFVVCCRQII